MQTTQVVVQQLRLIITVNDIIPSSITYTGTSFVETKGTPMTTGIPNVGGGPVVSWSISPGLPTGLNIDASTGEISGTPSALSTLTTYTITATNSGGSTSTTIDITVNDIIPSTVSYVPDTYTFTKGTSDSTSTPTANGGPVVSWEIHPTLPNGLSIDSSTVKSVVHQPHYRQSKLTQCMLTILVVVQQPPLTSLLTMLFLH